MTQQQIEIMKQAGSLLDDCFAYVESILDPEITTQEIDLEIAKFLFEHDAVSAFLCFSGFPHYACHSVDDVVAHGFPSSKPLGTSIYSLDMGLVYQGLIVDSARTYSLGKTKEQTDIISACESALTAGISAARAGNSVLEITRAVDKVCKKFGYEIVLELNGHGVGYSLHEDPLIPNALSEFRAEDDVLLEAGTTVCIEPMIVAGSNLLYTGANQWDLVTKDGSISAHTEETILIQNGPPLVLTRK